MCKERNIEARSCNYYCQGKAICITYSECVCSLSYPACNAHAPYCHLWPVRTYNIFPHYLTNGKIFEKRNVIEHKCYILIFSVTFV